MTESIENDFLKIEIVTAGAELKSIYHKKSQQEYLWQGNPDWWPRRAPVLFPIVGKLNNNTYHVDGKSYSLPQHGIARDNEFVIDNASAQEATFVLQSNAALLQIFPFQFELKITYSLRQSSINIRYEVKNTGTSLMYFSVGAHPGFALREGEALQDYYIEFEKPETLDRYLLEDGLFNGSTERVMTNENILALNNDLFKKDAIVLKHMKSQHLHLKSRKSNYALKISFEGFPLFGIWSKPGASFICLEPWCGIADHKGFEGELKDKEGIQELEQNGIFTRSFSIDIEG